MWFKKKNELERRFNCEDRGKHQSYVHSFCLERVHIIKLPNGELGMACPKCLRITDTKLQKEDPEEAWLKKNLT